MARGGGENQVSGGTLALGEEARHKQTEPESMRVLMAAGGTGGHIFPALAVAEELTARRRTDATLCCAVEFLGTGRGLESRLICAAGFRLHTIAAAGLQDISGWRKLRNLTVLPRSAVETARVLRETRPHVVVGMGGYLAGPAMLEAALQDLPTLLIEPNAVPGFTNLVLAPVVRLAAVGFEEAAYVYGPKARVTGLPVRRAFHQVSPKNHVSPFTVLIFGGSQGSAAINSCVLEALPLFATGTQRLTFIHQTGKRDYAAVRQAYEKQAIPAEVRAFIENMPEAFARADLVVSRAGATTVAELAAAGKAALLIPFPAATDHHQRENARALERAGGARVIEQMDLSPVRLAKEVFDMLDWPERLTDMERCARTRARPDAAQRIADLIEALAFNRQLPASNSRASKS